MTVLRVLHLASEAWPLIKTGGLADVAGALPAALAGMGHDVRLLLPGYPAVLSMDAAWRRVASLGNSLPGGHPGRLWKGRLPGQSVEVLALDVPALFERPGTPYQDEYGQDWLDNPIRFAALAAVGCWLALGGLDDWWADIVHAHDWQTALVHSFLAYADHGLPPGVDRPGRVITVHNLAFQGLCDPGLLPVLGLPPESFTIEQVEFWGRISFLKAGLVHADRIIAVSPTYAKEIRTPEGGFGMDGVVRMRGSAVQGILNGIDSDFWNPATDPYLSVGYDADRLEDRMANASMLRTIFQLDHDPSATLFAMVTRLAWQKGVDLVLQALPRLLASGGQLIVVGSGDAELEASLLAAAVPGSVGVWNGYDERLAHLVQGGADALLVPSRYEPCGLTQMYALRYGTIPVVHGVGGLADSVVDADEASLNEGRATGVVFGAPTLDALISAILRASHLCREQPALWRQMQLTGMAIDNGWRRAAGAYAQVYAELLATD